MTNLDTWLRRVLLAVAIVATASFAWEWSLTNRATRASLNQLPATVGLFPKMVKDAHGGMNDVFAETRDVTRQVLQPCKPGKPETCGLIPAARATTQAVGAQVAQTTTLVTAAANNLNTAGAAIQTVAGKLGGTADAGRSLLDAGTRVVDRFNDPSTGVTPMLAAFTGSAEKLNDFLGSQAIETATVNFGRTIAATANLTESAAGIAADGKRVADKEAQDWLKPVSWWQRPIKRAGDLIDIGAGIARHVP